MKTALQRSLLPFFLCVLSTSIVAHDDDRKILDREASYAGPGYTPGSFVSAARGAGMSAAQGTGFGSNSLLTSLSDNHLHFDSSGVELLAWLPLSELDGGAVSGNDCWGYVSPSGREYAIIGLSNGTTFVEVTLPSDPVLLEHISGPTSLWRDIKVFDHYAYIVSEGGGGIQVIDLGSIDAGIVNHVNTVTSGGTSATHNVAIDEDSGYLYRCGGSTGQGLRIYSLNNPGSPNYVGSWNERYVHDVQVVTYTSGPYSGREIAFACSGFGNGSGQTGLTILDVTNKSNITVRAQFHYPNGKYSHQAWLSEDRGFLFLNDELDEDGTLTTTTHVIDVSNIDAPFAAGTFTNGNRSIGHNLYTQGDLVFEANYRSGLRIFDTAAAPAATEVAYFDTYPKNDAPFFNGLWSCYPNLPSGTVLGSDIGRGLFIWWIGAPKLTFELASPHPTVLNPEGDSFELLIHEETAGDLQAGSERLYYDAGSGLVEVPLVAQGGELFEAQVPALPCLTELKWFVAARSTDGILWSYPREAPYNNFDSLVAYAEAIAFGDDMEEDTGWVSGSPEDTANQGFWERVVPVDTSAAPTEDHSADGVMCWVTGATDDVDGGFTTLTSPVFDIDGWADPILEFWMWYEVRGFTTPLDNCRIEVKSGAGSWILIERIESITGTPDSQWGHRYYHLSDWITPGASVQVRFRARDAEFDSRLEVGIDDLKVREGVCACTATPYCVAQPNSLGSSAQIFASGTLEVSQNNFTLGVSSAVPGNMGLFFYGPNQAQLPLNEGTLCVASGALGIFRLQPPLQVDVVGSASRLLDFTSLPPTAEEGGIAPGSIWNFQFWYRDPAGGPGGSNLSNALEVIFCP